MTPTPWAQAVEAMRDADLCPRYAEDTHMPELCGACLDAMLHAAAPHLLRAVTDGMTEGDMLTLFRGSRMHYYPEREAFRTALLAALTNAAGRVDAVTPDSHIGDHA